MKRLLSVIIPAYKQGKTIRKDLQNVHKVLSEGLSDYDFEIICVIDGEVDSTRAEAKKVKSSKIKVFGYPQNHGKGYAIRYGMARSKGDLISFLDAGMDISPNGITMLMSHIEWYGADIIVGSKRHPASRVNYPLRRRIYSIGYHLLVRMLFGLPLKDTQSGIKIFKREVLEKILPRLLVKKYAMDIEMLTVAWYLGFKRIYEAPIEVTFDKTASAVHWRTIFDMVWDTLAVFYRLRLLRYYDDSNRGNWVKDSNVDLTTNELTAVH